MPITCGIDWAEAHHDVALVDSEGRVRARCRIGTGVSGFSALVELIAEHGGCPEDTPVAIETDKNLLVVALAGAGFTVYPINPRAVARYRERHAQAGGKSDPGDAAVLANILRTDLHVHRPLPASTESCAGGQGSGAPAPGGHLGAAPDDQQAPLGAAGVLSPGGEGVS
jgi:transposase